MSGHYACVLDCDEGLLVCDVRLWEEPQKYLPQSAQSISCAEFSVARRGEFCKLRRGGVWQESFFDERTPV